MPFTGTNTAAFLDSQGNGHYLKVTDTDPRSTQWDGFESMSNIATGTNNFGTFYVGKNVVASSNSEWVIVADESAFALFVASAPASNAGCFSYNCFGKLAGGDSTDQYNTAIYGSTATTTSSSLSTAPGSTVSNGGFIFQSTWSGKLARPYHGAAGTFTPYVTGAAIAAATLSGSTSYIAPLQDGTISLTKPYVFDTNVAGSARGALPFVWFVRNALSSNLFQGFLQIAQDRILLRQGVLADGSTGGALVIETA